MQQLSRVIPNEVMRRCLLSLIVVCVGAQLSGCASMITPKTVSAAVSSPTTSTSTNAPSNSTSTTATGAAATTAFASVTNFGDSITCGYYALPNDGLGYMYSMEGYATLLDTSLHTASKDLCREGDQAADMAKLWVYPNTMPQVGQAQLYTALIGTNDAHFCGASAECMGAWSQALTASLSWLAMPLQDKVLGQDMTAAGDWVQDMEFGEATSGAGETLSFNVQQTVAGRSLYVAYRVFDPSEQQGGVATVTIDGNQVAVLNGSEAVSTQNGTKDTVFVARIPLGAVGPHSVTVTTALTGDGAGEFFSVLWAGVPTQSYVSEAGAPAVVVGSVTLTGSDELNGWVAQYNAALTPLVAGLAGDGLNVTIAPTGSALLPSDLVDLLHPGNAGHAKLAAAFENVLPQIEP